jgi:uncharacterized membrane protein
MLLAPLGLFFRLLYLAALGFQVYALVDAAITPAATFVAAGKLTKNAWLAILAVALIMTQFVSILSIFGLAGAVATLVYFVDVRPALRSLRG